MLVGVMTIKMFFIGLLLFSAVAVVAGVGDYYQQKRLNELMEFIKTLYTKDTLTDEDHDKLWSMKEVCRGYKITSINMLDRDLSVTHRFNTYRVNFEDQYYKQYTNSSCEGKIVKFLLLEHTDSEEYEEKCVYEKGRYIFVVLNKDNDNCYYLLVPIW
jgi:hypothetical protein